MPAFPIILERDWVNGGTGKISNSTLPERMSLLILVYHPNFPRSWKLFPDFCCHLFSNAEPTI
ncbi:MAG TPA: hypothetical protein PLB18_03315, partial [Acidobacteriota bacterium]|nr:hypothetical protein [Acidobacteriota bacterium]